MSTAQRISLLDAGLELTRHLTEDEHAELRQLTLPVVTVGPGALDVPSLLATHNAFGATVLEGIVMHARRIGEQTGVQLLGPGDLLVTASDASPDWLTEATFRTADPARLALFGLDLLAAVYRWPRVLHGFYACLGDQLQRLTAQLVICQMPRVDERVLAMFWLLAESWGQVTPSGVRLPLNLTHETLGALVGARRPTVTLALRKLTGEGALVHQDSGWLLLRRPPQPVTSTPRIEPPDAGDTALRPWAPAPAPAPAPELGYAQMRETLRVLREQYAANREENRAHLQRARSSRIRLTAMRERIREEAFRRRWPPSS